MNAHLLLALLAVSLLLMPNALLAAPTPKDGPNAGRTVQCDIQSVARDFYDRAPEHYFQCTDAATGNTFPLQFPTSGTGRQSIVTGDHATVQGSVAADGSLVVNSYSRTGRDHHFRDVNQPGSHDKRATVSRTVVGLVVRVRKADGTFMGTIATDTDSSSFATTLSSTLLGATSSTADLFRSCSFSSYDIVNSQIYEVVVPSQCSTTVGNAYYSPLCSRSYNLETSCNNNEVYGFPEYALSYLESQGIGFSRNNFQHKVIVMPYDLNADCNFVGMGNVGCSSSYCYVWVTSPYAGYIQAYGHELGHNLGLAHAGFYGKTGNDLEYGDFSCAMGYCCSTRCFNAPHGFELGYVTPMLSLSSSNLAAGASTTVTLPSISVSNTGTITVLQNWAGTATRYWIQLKTADGYDQFASSSWLNNVQIKKWNSGDYERADHMATLGAGGVWTDSTNTLRITAVSISTTSKSASIKIEHLGSTTPCKSLRSSCTSSSQCCSGKCVNRRCK